jgi:Undecaprenyl-phosphate glucose phosphotransferase
MKNEQNGIAVLGFVGDRMNADELGVEKLGGFQDLGEILDRYKPSDVVFAIDAYDKRRLIKLVNMCDDRCIKVYFLPVIYGFFKTPNQIEKVGSLPIINIHQTPLDNRANAFLKRAVDIVGSLVLIILTLPIMLVAAIGVRISSPGPIFFKQKRVGKLGKVFTMYKFRSMVVNDAQNEKWTTDTDNRKTKFGNFIRKTSIDELPQLFNVLFGSMSLVGPRPEIPVFVNHFKEIIPLYMVKHYVKPGMTGLAQVKGLRGDTSVVDRIHEDIEYIENWSLLLDIQILFQTPLKAINKNEKYVGDKEKDGGEAEKEEKTSNE